MLIGSSSNSSSSSSGTDVACSGTYTTWMAVYEKSFSFLSSLLLTASLLAMAMYMSDECRCHPLLPTCMHWCHLAARQIRNKTVFLQYSNRQEIGAGNWTVSGSSVSGGGYEMLPRSTVIIIIMDNIQVLGCWPLQPPL